MDLLPGYFCGAHFLIAAEKPLQSIDDYISGGRALQRLWLTATSLALQFQPEMTPLIFARYSATALRFTEEARCMERARQITQELSDALDSNVVALNGVFLGRVGTGARPSARSLRLSPLRLTAERGDDEAS